MNPVVIDTNCLLQIISHGSPYRPIWDAFLAGQYMLCVSNEILDEYQEILEQQITPTVAENVVMLLLNQQNVQLVDPHFRSRQTPTITSSWTAPLPQEPTIWCLRTAISAYSTTRRSRS